MKICYGPGEVDGVKNLLLKGLFFSSKAYIFFYFEVCSFLLIVQPHEITFFSGMTYI